MREKASSQTVIFGSCDGHSREVELNNVFDSASRGNFNPLPIVLVVLAMLLLVSLWFQSYSQEVSIPRYCGNSAQSLQHLEAVLTNEQPAGDESRRPYLIAAKLLFLLPQQAGETTADYLYRLELYLKQHCSGLVLSTGNDR